jgi:hypothetical protein
MSIEFSVKYKANSNHNKELVLTDKTVLMLMKEHEISREQAIDLWDKTVSFNNIMLLKIVVTPENFSKAMSSIMSNLIVYQIALVAKYKKTGYMIAAACIIQTNVREYLKRKRINKGLLIEMGEVD